jgi:hypothetical protein
MPGNEKKGMALKSDCAAAVVELSGNGRQRTEILYRLSSLNFLDEVPYFAAEVLPRLARLGVRTRCGRGVA